MELLPVGFLIWLHALHPYPFHPFQPHDAPDGNLINLARADRDLPVDNAFDQVGAQYTVSALNQALTNNLPSILSAMDPSTDDPTIRNVTINVSGNDVEFSFQKHIAFLWDTVNIDASTSVSDASCPVNGQAGFEVLFTMLGSTSEEAQGYVNGARILICAQQTQTADGPDLEVTIERDLFAGPEYQDWIGSLMGDFMRNFGPTLKASLAR